MTPVNRHVADVPVMVLIMFIDLTGEYRNGASPPNGEHLSSKQYFVDAYRNGVFNSTASLGSEVDDYYVETYQGFDVSNFHARLKKGELLPLTPYLKVANKFDELNGSFHLLSVQGGANWEHIRRDGHGNRNGYLQFKTTEGFPFLYSPLNRADAAIARNQVNFDYLLQQAASSIYTRGWDAGTFLAEFGRLVQMFRRIGSTLASLLEMVKDPSLIFSAEPANLWLQERYGWRTLVYDIQDMSDAISALSKKQNRIAKERKGYVITETRDLSTTKSFTFMDVKYQAIETSVLSVRGTIMSDFVPPAFYFNPVLTTYETIRFSFVLDWVINVGQALEAMSFAVLAPQYTSAYSYQHEVSFKGTVTTVTPKPGFTSGTFTQNISQETKVIRRVPRQLSLVPQVSLRLDAFKVTDIVALIVQTFAKILRR